MRDLNFKGIVFAVFCLVFGVSSFLPYMKVDAEYMGEKMSETSRLMPGVYGYIMLVIAVFGIFVLLTGMKNKAAITGAAATVFVLVRAFTDEASAKKMGQSLNMLNAFSNALLDRQGEVSFSWSHSGGFYIMILGAVGMLLFGLLYTLSEDN